MSSRRRGRAVNGILVLDKPAGMTSNAALQKAKRLFNAAKAGHTGSLDPMATGVLPLCLGEATKFAQHLLEGAKAYRATARLGVVTDTGDREGTVLSESPVPVGFGAGMLAPVLDRFRGDIEQVPPMYSALKHKGRPLYELAREGKTVERAPRQVRIDRLDLLEVTADSFTVDVACSKGTYIRTLVEDIGAALGCGAHLADLRRTTAAGFSLDQAVTLETLEAADMSSRDEYLLPVDRALALMPEIQLESEHLVSILNGQAVRIDGCQAPGLVRLYAEQQFIGMGECLLDGRVAPRRLLSTAN